MNIKKTQTNTTKSKYYKKARKHTIISGMNRNRNEKEKTSQERIKKLFRQRHRRPNSSQADRSIVRLSNPLYYFHIDFLVSYLFLFVFDCFVLGFTFSIPFQKRVTNKTLLTGLKF